MRPAVFLPWLARHRLPVSLVAVVLPVVLAACLLIFHRGLGRYGAPDFGGPEPRETHKAALEIIATGKTTMTFHVPGYAYVAAAVYGILPQRPLSVILVQILLLPILVLHVGRLTACFVGVEAGRALGRLFAGAYVPFAYYSCAFSSIVPPLFLVSGFVILGLSLFEKDKPVMTVGLCAGILLGLAVCLRPNLAFAGVFLFLGLWVAFRSLWEAVRRSALVAAVSLSLLAAMAAANPAEEGLLRGGSSMGYALLQGTYQYSERWWDWEWVEVRSDRGTVEFDEHIRSLEKRTGRRIAVDPDVPGPTSEVRAILLQEAHMRIREHPLLFAKKLAISFFRLWILVPTHLSSLPAKVIIAVCEALVFVLCAVGLSAARMPVGKKVFLIGTLFTPHLLHMMIVIEPRYTLPVRGLYIAFAAAGLVTLLQRATRPPVVPREQQSRGSVHGGNPEPIKSGETSEEYGANRRILETLARSSLRGVEAPKAD